MYIRLIHYAHVHIYDKNSFVYTIDHVYELDDISTCLIAILRLTSVYDELISIMEKELDLACQDAKNLTNEIIRVNHQFLTLSDIPNPVMITGRLNTRFPSMLQISLTSRCVHRCKHRFKECDDVSGEDLPYDALIHLLNQMKGKSRFIEFTGGEPFLYS